MGVKILSIQQDPLTKFPYLNAGRRPNDFFVDELPVLLGSVDRLPDGLEAIIVTADLQGRETFRKDPECPIRLLGEVLPLYLEPILKGLGIVSARNVGAILAGDFYSYPDLRGRGGTGDVCEVWKSFSNSYRWVAGVAGNHDTFGNGWNTIQTQSHVRFLDGTHAVMDGLRIAGLSGVIGKPTKNFRRTHHDFLDALEELLRDPPEILIMHDGPDGNQSRFRGIVEVREIVERRKPALVVRGHKHWPEPLVELSGGVQVLNVEATVVILVEDAKIPPPNQIL